LSPAADGAPPAATPPANPVPPPLEPRSKRLVREYGEAVVLALLVALAVRALAAETFSIPTASMAPTLLAGDQVLVSKVSYGLRLPFVRTWVARWGEPRRGDVLVFEHPERAGEVHVKRVLGIPGDVVELRGQVVHVNGEAQPRERMGAIAFEEKSGTTGAWWRETCTRWRERLARDPSATKNHREHDVLQCRDPAASAVEGPFQVEPGHFFVAGDNRDRSEDGRAGGWRVPMSHVVGNAVRVLWSRGPPDGEAEGPDRFRPHRLFKPVE
jgi:signal peptidase I